MTLLQRLVSDVTVQGGVLRPLDAWTLELARGERRIHRELAALRDAPSSAIARMASRRGLLRTRASSLVHQFTDSYWQEQALRMGQSREDDLEAAVAWAQNPTLPHPAEADDILRAATAFLGFVGDEDLAGMEVFFSGAPWKAVTPMLDAADAAGDIPALHTEALLGLNTPPDAAVTQTARLAVALRVAQAFAERLGRDQELVDRPGSASFGRTLAAVVRTVPAAVTVEELADETLDEWRSTARLFADWIELADLLRAASSGLTRPQRIRLEALLESYVQWSPPKRRSNGELASLAMPIVTARIEQALTSVGAWPPPRNEPIGLFARALLSLWRDLTDERLPKRCAAPGCTAVLSAHWKARLCLEHAAERQRRRVARRQRATGS